MHTVHIFARLAHICMLSRCLVTTFLHRSSGGSLFKSALLVGHVSSSAFGYHFLLCMYVHLQLTPDVA